MRSLEKQEGQTLHILAGPIFTNEIKQFQVTVLNAEKGKTTKSCLNKFP